MLSGKLFLVTGLLVAAVSTPFAAFAQEGSPSESNTHLNFIVGQKMLDDKDWNKEFKAAGLPNLKTHTSFGLEATYGPGTWPVSIATDVLYSSASGKSTALNRTVTGSTLELGIGARKVFTLGMPIHPYVGGGLAYGSGAVTCSGCSSRAPSGTGFWVNGGAFYSLSRLNAGLGFRYSSIEGKDGNLELNVGGINVNALVGFGF